MQAWSAPEVPRLPISPSPTQAQAFDTASGLVVGVGPASGPVRMYVCGITPYDATHLGHANTYVAFDLLNRIWRDAGLAVEYVQNVTDVDDPLLEEPPRPESLGTARCGADRAVHRGHGGAERPPAGALRRCRRIGGPGHRSDRAPAGTGRGVSGRRSGVRGSVLRPIQRSGVRLVGQTGRGRSRPPVRRAGRRSRPSGQEAPAGLSAVAAAARGRARLGIALRARAARLARRVHRAGPASARHHLRRAGRRPGPDLSPPRDVCRRGASRDGGGVRPRVPARRDGRARRGEDVEVQGEPGLRVRAPEPRESTRW